MFEMYVIAETVAIVMVIFFAVVLAAFLAGVLVLLVLDWILKYTINGLSYLVERLEQRHDAN